MDDELFKSAHEPAALWAKYLARRQARNPLYLRRTLSYCPEATRIGDAPAAPAVASPRYVKLRLAANLAAYPARTVADAGDKWLCLTLYERRAEGYRPLEAARPLRLAVAREPRGAKKAGKKRKADADGGAGGDEVWVAFGVEASAALAGERDLVVALQLFDAPAGGNDRLDWASGCAFAAAVVGEADARARWPVAQRGAATPLARASHAALRPLAELAGGAGGGGLEALLAAGGPGRRGGFDSIALAPLDLAAPEGSAGAAALTLPVGAALSALPVAGPPPAAGAAAEPPAPPAAAAADPPSRAPACVFYHLVYDASGPGAAPRLASRVDRVDEPTCAWCAASFGDARGLVAHLVAHHSPQLRFEALLDDRDRLHVVATPAELHVPRPGDAPADGDGGGAADFSYLRREGAPVAAPAVPRAAAADAAAVRLAAVAAADAADDAAKPPGAAAAAAARARPPPTRQYYHARTSAPIAPQLLAAGYDSDDDVDEEWRLERAEQLLEEFEDVTPQEKAFMKLWNRWVFRNPIQADRTVPRAVNAFAADLASQLVRQNLRHNLLLHLLHLWDNSLLSAQNITDCMAIVDDKAAQQLAAEGA